jgi:hypothetical protein
MRYDGFIFEKIKLNEKLEKKKEKYDTNKDKDAPVIPDADDLEKKIEAI